MRASAIIAVVLAFAVAVWMLSGKLGGGGAPPAATGAGSGTVSGATGANPSPLRVRVERMSARNHAVVLTVRGRSEAGRRVDLRAETDGRIVEIGASRGDEVQKGNVLARLTDEGRLARVAEYRARLRQREIHYEATVELSKRGLSSKEALATAKADIDAARAAVEQIEVEIARTRLRAPFDGLLLEGHADFGDYLTQGDSFGHIIDLDPILFVGSVTERSVARLRTGLPAVARSLGGDEIRGTLRYIAPAADPATRTYRIEVEAANPGYRIREGITVGIAIETDTRMAHFVTPALLSLADDGAIGIKTVDAENRVRFHPVDIIEDTPDGIWLAGLPREIRVITVGQDFVAAGQEVTPVASADPGGAPGGGQPGLGAPAADDPAMRGPTMRGPTMRGPTMRGPTMRGPAGKAPAESPQIAAPGGAS